MKQGQQISLRIYDKERLAKQLRIWKLLGKSVAFTNGVFDILHQGHLSLLSQAAAFTDILIVGVNSDSSVKWLKGPTRPINDEHTRQLMLASLLMVDAVILFEEDTPLELIKSIMPEVLIKGGDYTVENIVGAKEVINQGGRVEIVQLSEGLSTTNTIQKIKGAADHA